MADKKRIEKHIERVMLWQKKNYKTRAEWREIARGYIPDGDWRKVIYWISAAVLTFTVTF